MPTPVQFGLSLTVLSIAVVTASSAGAWDRHTKVTGPDGKTISSHAYTNCHDDECRGKQVIVGPDGKTLVRTGTARCHDDECEGTVRVTGPEGGTVTRRVTIKR